MACCARAANGTLTAALPTSAMNSRRFMPTSIESSLTKEKGRPLDASALILIGLFIAVLRETYFIT
jgi:hypothetical protein